MGISSRLAKKLAELAESYGEKKKDAIQINLSLTQKELGDMIGATRESVNKELKILHEKGLIVKEGNKIKICDMERLKRKF